MLLSQSKKIIKIIAGTLLVASSYYIFQKPNGITAPGLGGIAILLADFFHSPLGLVYFILNIPLFFIGFRSIGLIFAILSLAGMSLLSFFLAILIHLPILPFPFLGCILGGLFSGIGLGMVINVGATTGGLDIASVVIAKHFPKFTIGRTMMGVNACVLLLTLITEGLNHAVLTFVNIIIAGKSVDVMLSVLQQSKKREASL